MLNPNDIKYVSLQKASRNSYKAEDVNAFLETVFDSYSQLYRENSELIAKLQLLAEKIEAYRREEESIGSALVAAQKTAERIVLDTREGIKSERQEAKQKAVKMLADAELKSNMIINSSNEKAAEILTRAKEEADNTIKVSVEESEKMIREAIAQAEHITSAAKLEFLREKDHLANMQKEVLEFKTKLMSVYKAHVSLINELSTVQDETNLGYHSGYRDYVEPEPPLAADLPEPPSSFEDILPSSFEEDYPRIHPRPEVEYDYSVAARKATPRENATEHAGSLQSVPLAYQEEPAAEYEEEPAPDVADQEPEPLPSMESTAYAPATQASEAAETLEPTEEDLNIQLPGSEPIAMNLPQDNPALQTNVKRMRGFNIHFDVSQVPEEAQQATMRLSDSFDIFEEDAQVPKKGFLRKRK